MVDPNDNGVVAHVPAFLSKLWRLVEDRRYDDLIAWASNGRSFIIKNQSRFSKELLPLYFKHNNMASFIRQLNMYGFRKSTSIENSGLKADKDEMEFYHQYFLRGQESMLEFIKRKVATPTKGIGIGSPSVICDGSGILKNDDVREMLTGIRAIRDRQDSTDNCLVAIQQENGALWKEIAVLRQKHAKQQQIIERLIQFLMTLVQKQPNVVFKRKQQLMIDGGPDDDIFSTNGITLLDNPEPSPKRLQSDRHTGPVIHDVTDDILEAELEAGANGNPIVSHVPGGSPVPINVSVDDILSPGDLIGADSNCSIPTGSDEISPTSSMSSDIGIGLNGLENNSKPAAGLQTPQIIPTSPVAGVILTSASVTGTKVTPPITTPSIGEGSTTSGVVVDPSTFTKDYFSDHVEGVDVELNWLQDQLQFGGLDIDPDNILGLFTADSPPGVQGSSSGGPSPIPGRTGTPVSTS